MSQNTWEVRSGNPDIVEFHIRLLGTGAAAPTREEPAASSGITVTRSGVGAYTLTWAENPGNFVNCSYMIGAATPANVAGHTVIRDTFASLALPIVLYNASDAAHDLAASEYIDLTVRFKRTNL